MPEGRRREELARALERGCRGAVVRDDATLARYARDFGGMVEASPSVVLRPASDDDVTFALRAAHDLGAPVTVRGAAHGQSGQGLGEGLVLDMTALDRVLAIDEEERVVEVEAGARWFDVLSATLARGLMPVGLTHALDPTVAGTLSVGGVGGESFRVGPQVDCVRSFDVATPAGGVERCSAREGRDLFDAVRGGLGQCAVVLRARYPLRRAPPFFVVQTWIYRDPRAFVRDAVALADPAATDRWIAGAATRHPLEPERLLFGLIVGHESEAPAAGQARSLPRLGADFASPPKAWPLASADGGPGHGFFRLFEPPSPSVGAARPTVNPWVEHLLGPDAARAVLERLAARGGSALGAGQAGIILVRRGAEPAPLFQVPDGDLAVGVGLFGAFPARERARAEAVAAEHVASARGLGGKRYLSGYRPFADADAASHFGDSWAAFRATKARVDPGGLLNAQALPRQ